MSTLRHTRPIHLIFARLTVMLLALTVLLSSQPIRAAAPAGARPTPSRRVRSDPAVNHNPVAVGDNLAAFADQDFQTLYVLDNDTDVDGDPLTVFSTTVPAHGSIFRPNDHLEVDYTPDSGYSGLDSFNYKVIDGNGGSAIGTV